MDPERFHGGCCAAAPSPSPRLGSPAPVPQRAGVAGGLPRSLPGPPCPPPVFFFFFPFHMWAEPPLARRSGAAAGDSPHYLLFVGLVPGVPGGGTGEAHGREGSGICCSSPSHAPDRPLLRSEPGNPPSGRSCSSSPIPLGFKPSRIYIFFSFFPFVLLLLSFFSLAKWRRNCTKAARVILQYCSDISLLLFVINYYF